PSASVGQPLAVVVPVMQPPDAEPAKLTPVTPIPVSLTPVSLTPVSLTPVSLIPTSVLPKSGAMPQTNGPEEHTGQAFDPAVQTLSGNAAQTGEVAFDLKIVADSMPQNATERNSPQSA